MADADWTADDIPDQSGRVAVVTGANSGLGLETARELARKGATVVLAVRNTSKGRVAVDDIRAEIPSADVSVQELDLASLDSVRSAAQDLFSLDRLDLLINNAGVMYTPFQTTADGFEMQFGTNHLGHFALTGLLLDKLTATEGSRVVSVSSVGHRIRSAIDFDTVNSPDGYSRVAAYGRSKLANLLFTYELQRHLEDAAVSTSALAAHPGGSATELSRHIPSILQPAVKLLTPLTQSAAMGALPTLRAATDPSATGGEYYGPDGFMETRGHPVLVETSARSHDRGLQHELWDYSEAATGLSYPL